VHVITQLLDAFMIHGHSFNKAQASCLITTKILAPVQLLELGHNLNHACSIRCPTERSNFVILSLVNLQLKVAQNAMRTENLDLSLKIEIKFRVSVCVCVCMWCAHFGFYMSK
jgi:hypothetical protein